MEITGKEGVKRKICMPCLKMKQIVKVLLINIHIRCSVDGKWWEFSPSEGVTLVSQLDFSIHAQKIG